MQELIGKLFAALPLYCRQLLALLSGPRTALLQQDLESHSALQQALTFIAVSFGIAYVAEMPFILGGQSNERTFGFLAVVSALGFGLNVILMILAWRIVGGRMAVRKVLIVTCYFSGVFMILILVPFLVAAGIFKVLAPTLYQQNLNGKIPDPSDLFKSGGLMTFLALLGMIVIAAYAWTFWIWGAFRKLMQRNKLQSGIAFFVFAALSPWLLIFQLFMVIPIVPLHATPPLPQDLIGKWQKILPAGANGIVEGDAVTYSFVSTGFGLLESDVYEKETLERHGEISAKCPVSVRQFENGSAILQDSTLVLRRAHQWQTATDACSGKITISPYAPSEAEYEYQYQMAQQSSGWKLCLTRLGVEECFTPDKP
jgi:hypothetical protein